MVQNQIADFGKFYLVSEFSDADSTIDIVAASPKYTMEDQKNPGTLFTSGRMVLLSSTNTENFISLAFSNCVANGEVGGRKRYTLTVRVASDGITKMIGLANTDDGSDSKSNVIADNSLDDDGEDIFPFPADSFCLITVGSAEYNELLALFQSAVAEIEDETNNLSVRLVSMMQEMEQRLKDDQSEFETDIQQQQDDFEEQQQQNFDNFEATQRNITGIKKETDATKLVISAGDWLDGVTPRNYAGAEVTPTLSQTTYYELESGSGNLISNASGFNAGNFPICSVVTDGAGISIPVKNYGAAYQVQTTSNDGDVVTIQMRRDTASDFTSDNPTLASGEHGYETDTGKFKIGDGLTAWSGLDYFTKSSSGSISSGFDLKMPISPFQGTFTVKSNITANYTIPTGKALMIMNAYTGSTSYVDFDGTRFVYQNFGRSSAYAQGILNPIVLIGDGVKQLEPVGVDVSVNAVEFDASLIGDLDFVFEIVNTASVYTVPSGRAFVMTNRYGYSNSIFQVSTDNGVTWDDIGYAALATNAHQITIMHFNEGDQIRSNSALDYVIMGYEIDKTYKF